MKTIMVLAAIASVAIAASPASSGASFEVTRDLTLGADVACDSVSVAANATLNLNGHILRTGRLTGGGGVASFREMPLPRGYELLSHVTTPTNNLAVKGYINTEYVPNATDRIETKFRLGYVGSGNANIQSIFSARTSTAQNAFDCCLNSSAKLDFPYNTTGSLVYGNAGSGGEYEVVMDGGRGRLEVVHGGETKALELPSNEFTPGYNLKLFCTAESLKERNAQGLTMYYFRVFNAAGGLEVNMLPALDPSGIAGFYDTVRRKFYKLSSGALTPGVVISYDALSYVKTPAGNTGTFVDTGYKPSPSDRVETRVMFGNMSQPQGIFSARYNYNQNTFACILRKNSRVSFEHVDSGTYEAYHAVDGVQTTYSVGKIYDLAMDGNTAAIEVNGVVSGTRMGSSLEETSTNFVLFACADAIRGTISGFAKDLRMYSFRVTDTNGCERLNLVPARTRREGITGFYDTVRNRFLRTTIAATAESVAAATDFTTPGGTCWASLPGAGDMVVANLFNDNFEYKTDSTHRFYIGQSYILPLAIDYDLGENNEQAVNMLRICGGYTGRSPSIWAFFGSNDDAAFSAADESAWTLLDFKIDEPAWATGGKREMVFANDTPYRYYRLKAFAGNGIYFDLTQLEFLRVDIAATACPLEAGPAFADLTVAGGRCTARTADGEGFYNDTTADNLFNDNYIHVADSTHRLIVNSNARFPIAIDYDFGESNAKAVNAYKVYASEANRCPTKWTVYGSDTAYGSADDTGWTKLDARSGVENWTYAAIGNPADCKTFAFKNDTPYRYYRFLWEAGETTGAGTRYNAMTQLEYFRIDGDEAPGALIVAVADGATVTNETVAVGGALKVVKEGAGEFATCASNAFYTGGTVVKEGTFTAGAPLATAMTLADGATLGFLLSQGVQSPLLALDAASSFPSAFDVEVGRSDSFKIPQSGFTLTDGVSFVGKTVNLANPSPDFAPKVKLDASGHLVVMGPSGFMIIFR